MVKIEKMTKIVIYFFINIFIICDIFVLVGVYLFQIFILDF